MPTPLEILLDPISLAVMGIYALLFIWESLFPGRKLPKMKFWVLRGIVAFFCYFFLASYLPLLWDNHLARYQLFDFTGYNPVLTSIAGVLLYELGIYTWHRTMHGNDRLWRMFHQMHHSVERIDIPSAFYFSPLDMIGWTVIGSLSFALIMGLSPQATTIVLLTLNFIGMFQHANIKTPRWLGYIIQRPESHSIHHAKGIHAHNYSDLPIFDIIFGTFKNPKDFEAESGFYPGASSQVVDMLTFKDLNNAEKPARIEVAK